MAFDPTAWDPTGRFTGLADLYSRHRPDYPGPAIDYIMACCGLKPGALLVDVGCGTGISSRQLAERGLRVIGIEPNADMRRQAQAVSHNPQGSEPEYRAGQAEATGLETGVADAVLAAQAFHWFDPEPTLREFHRILKPGGWVALMWNERHEADPFTSAFGDVVRTAKDAVALEKPRPLTGEALLHSTLFTQGERQTFEHEQTLDEDGLIGRAMSASYSPRDEAEGVRFMKQLRQVFGRFQKDGRVVLKYVTSATVGRRT
jgi:SAM-dependent methyltransferase